MRQRRRRGKGHHFVHALSRVIDRRYIFHTEEKNYFIELIENQYLFSGVKVVTKSVMSNHFHLLLEQIDRKKIQKLSWKQLEKRLSAIYSEAHVQSLKNKHDNLIKINDQELIDDFFQQFVDRMNDVSVFMKEVKQKFTQWYNNRNGRKGTLWEGRFKSVIVEGAQDTLLVMAAYIDLNPVRAGIVTRLEDYKWCGYTAAVGGNRQAQEGLGIILDQSHQVCGDDFAKKWQETLKLYRLWLYHQGRQVTGDAEQGIKAKKGFSAEEIERVELQDDPAAIASSLRKRVTPP